MPEPSTFGDSTADILRRVEMMAERAAAGELPTGPDPVSVAQAETVSRGRAPLPRRFRTATVADLSGQRAKIAREWIDGGMVANVLLLGSVGVGKTHMACALARHAWDDGLNVLFLPVVELLDQLRPDGIKDAMSRATNADVLVLDDLGGERPTDWTGERLYAVINRRWLEERPTIVTSNLTGDDLEAAAGPRVWSRLYHGAMRLSVGGTDRRKGTA